MSVRRTARWRFPAGGATPHPSSTAAALSCPLTLFPLGSVFVRRLCARRVPAYSPPSYPLVGVLSCPLPCGRTRNELSFARPSPSMALCIRACGSRCRVRRRAGRSSAQSRPRLAARRRSFPCSFARVGVHDARSEVDRRGPWHVVRIESVCRAALAGSGVHPHREMPSYFDQRQVDGPDSVAYKNAQGDRTRWGVRGRVWGSPSPLSRGSRPGDAHSMCA